jgi:hypothetical protein
MEARRELIEAVGDRYRKSERVEKKKILDEFVELAGYHRKHAIRGIEERAQRQNSSSGNGKPPVRRGGDHSAHHHLGIG